MNITDGDATLFVNGRDADLCVLDPISAPGIRSRRSVLGRWVSDFAYARRDSLATASVAWADCPQQAPDTRRSRTRESGIIGVILGYPSEGDRCSRGVA